MRKQPHPDNRLINVLSQMFPSQHRRPGAGRMANYATNNHTHDICLSSKPAAWKVTGMPQ